MHKSFPDFCRALALLLVLGALLGWAPAWANPPQEKVNAKARLSSGIISLGEKVFLTLSVDNAAKVKIVALPNVEGLAFGDVSDPLVSAYTAFRNGTTMTVRTATWELPLVVGKVGEFELGSLTLEVDGQRVEVPITPSSLKVVKDVKAGSFGFFETPGRPKRVYEGQPFQLVLKLGWVDRLEIYQAGLSLPWWNSLSGVLEVSGPGFQSRAQKSVPIPVNQRYQLPFEVLPPEEIDGEKFFMMSHTLTKVATRSGTLKFPTSTFAFAEQLANSGSTFRGSRLKEYYASLEAFEIEVLPVPEETSEGPRPFDWSGAVGELAVDRRLSSQDLRAGETVQLEVIWTGMANTEFFDVPDLKRLDAFSDFRVLGAEDSHLGMERRVVYELVPLTETITQVPPVPLWLFNPTTELFEKIESEPMPIRVAPADDLDLNGAFGAEGEGEGKRDLRDVHDLAQVAGGESRGGPPGWGIASLCAAILLGWMYLRKLVRRHGDPSSAQARAQRRAESALKRELAGARDASAKSAAARRFLGTRSGESSEAWIGRDVRAWAEERRAGASVEAVVTELHRLQESLEGAVFAGDASPPTDGEILQTLTRFSKEAKGKGWIA